MPLIIQIKGPNCFDGKLKSYFFHFSGIASFCKTRPVACKFPFYDGNGDLHNNCTNTKLYADDENSSENVNFLWCATETNEDDDMVFWGKCDLESCFPEKKGNYLVLKSYYLEENICICCSSHLG